MTVKDIEEQLEVAAQIYSLEMYLANKSAAKGYATSNPVREKELRLKVICSLMVQLLVEADDLITQAYLDAVGKTMQDREARDIVEKLTIALHNLALPFND